MKNNNLTAIALISISLIVSTPIYAVSIVQPMTDTVNSGIINSRIVGNDAYSNVDATVENGVAIFRGTVETQRQAYQLNRIARSVSGVRGVDTTRLRVRR